MDDSAVVLAVRPGRRPFPVVALTSLLPLLLLLLTGLGITSIRLFDHPLSSLGLFTRSTSQQHVVHSPRIPTGPGGYLSSSIPSNEGKDLLESDSDNDEAKRQNKDSSSSSLVVDDRSESSDRDESRQEAIREKAWEHRPSSDNRFESSSTKQHQREPSTLDVPIRTSDGVVDDFKQDIVKRRSSEAFDLLQQRFPGNNKDLRSRYPAVMVADDVERERCLQLARRRWAESLSPRPSNAYNRLAEEISALSDASACLTTKKYLLLGRYHFIGGNILFDSYLQTRNWTKVDMDIPLTKGNFSMFDALPRDLVIVFAACKRVLPVLYLHRRIPLISMAPNERLNVLKIPFFRSIQNLFTARGTSPLRGCDYRRFHPESYLIETADQCRVVANTVLSKSRPDQVWFIKTAMESFGDGISVVTTDKALREDFDPRRCTETFSPNRVGGRLHPEFLIQRKVDGIRLVNGRNTQGRAYFLISSYQPLTVWFFMGYFNVAGAPISKTTSAGIQDDGKEEKGHDGEDDAFQGQVNGRRIESISTGETSQRKTKQDDDDEDLKAVHVTNLRTNQDSKRLLFPEFMEGRPRSELEALNRDIKIAALTAFFALQPKLKANKGSFSLFGFDFLVQDNPSGIKVLETNCNCELFADETAFGSERVMLSRALVENMMDIVLAGNLNPEGFQSLLRAYLSSGNNADELRRAPDEFFRTDAASSKGGRSSWELLYTDIVQPPFVFANVSELYCK